MKKSIFEVITDYAVNEGLSSVIKQDDEYRKIQNKISDTT